VPRTETRPRRSAAETREHVLTVAHELFYWHGIRATGIDAVAAAAEVAPTTLYRLFASKDDLVAAYVQRAADLYRQWFSSAAQAGGSDSPAQIQAIFDALIDQVQPDQCRGCPFLMALSEFPDPATPAHQHAADLKAWVREQFRQLSAGLDSDDPAALADQLTLIFEGVYASVQALGVEGPTQQAPALAALLTERRPSRRSP
jgi:AcrR family transcriptional regulator